MLWTATTLALALAPTHAVPSPPASDEVAITWTSVEGCPGRDVVTGELTSFLAERGFVGDGSASAVGSIAADDDGYVLRLDVRVAGRNERRTLQATDCDLLARAGALVIAVAVDALAATIAIERRSEDGGHAQQPPAQVPEPEAAAEADDEPQLELGPDVPPASSATPVLQTEAPPRRSTPWPLALTLGAHGGLGGGLVPGLGGGIEGELGLRLGPLRVEAAGYHWFARTHELEPDAGVRVAVSGAWLRGGYAWSLGRVEIPLSAGVDLAAMHGAGTGARVDAIAVRALWVAATAGPGVTVWLGRRFALTARVDAILAARQPAMFLGLAGSPTVAYRMPDAGFRLMLGGRVRFWETDRRLGGAR